jgi:hypothetical protein
MLVTFLNCGNKDITVAAASAATSFIEVRQEVLSRRGNARGCECVHWAQHLSSERGDSSVYGDFSEVRDVGGRKWALNRRPLRRKREGCPWRGRGWFRTRPGLCVNL